MTILADVSSETFETEVLSSPIPVIVDFWAEWCVRCRQMMPILEKFAQDYEGKIKLVKLNIEDNANIAADYGVISLPAVYLFANGVPEVKTTGVLTRKKLEEEFAHYLS